MISDVTTAGVADTAAVAKRKDAKAPAVDAELVGQLVAQARSSGLQLTGEGGLLAQLTKMVVESALDGEITDHLGYDHGDPAGRGTGNSRNGTRSKTVVRDVGPVEIDVPRDRDASFEPQIVRKRQRRLNGVENMVLSLSAKGLTHGEISAHHPARTTLPATATWPPCLRASTLADMARKMAYIGNADGGLSLIELAQVRSDRLSATTRAMLSALRAQYLAAVKRPDEALSEVARADEYFAQRSPATDAPWLCFYDEAEHLGSTGKALIPVAQAQHRIDLAAPRIQRAVDLQAAEYPRSQTFSLTRLATLTMQLGDPKEAVALGIRAATQASQLDSHRIHNELQRLAAASSPHRRMRDVVELREVITRRCPARAAP